MARTCGRRLATLAACLLLNWFPLNGFPLNGAAPIAAGVPDSGPTSQAVSGIEVEPASIRLTHPRQPHSILVTLRQANAQSLDLTAEATFASQDERIARVDPLGWVEPVSSGSTVIEVEAAGQRASINVIVEFSSGRVPYSFRHEIMPLFSKAACNQGACHGYSLGKNGFRLSLRGGDERQDYYSVSQEFLGRRINRQQPELSLLVRKATGDLPHGGGIRLEPGDVPHRTLIEWIGEGAPGDLESPLRLESVSVAPSQAVLTPDGQQQLQVRATYSDGSQRDVSRLAVFTSNADMLASVDESGLVTAYERGETAVVVRFERVFAVANIVVLAPDAGFVDAEVPQDNLIDRYAIEKLNSVRIRPSELATDAEYLRRVYIDLIGLQPAPDEVRSFLADGAPDKRERVVDALFARPEFVDHWSLKWGDLLQNGRSRLSEEAMWSFREWIRGAVASNMPLDQFARELVTARGSYRDDPASAWLLISRDENDTLQRATQVFCGVRMLCSKCHNHPFENWTQADYYGLASFFNQVASKQDPLLPGNGNAKSVTLNLAAAHAMNPRSGGPQPPRFLGGGEADVPSGTDRRTAYALWLTSPDNPFFGRSLVNRMWSYFFHRGIIDPVDDVRSTNPPINPALLDSLAADFIEHGFDARHLMRRIVGSRTYQRSSLANETNASDELNFSRAVPRRLRAEVILDCLVQATSAPENFNGAPEGFRAAQLPDASAGSELLNLLGKPQRMEACECQRSDGSNMLQALQFINGPAILARVARPGGRVEQLVANHPGNEQLTQELYLWALARFPSETELRLAGEHFAAYGEMRLAAAQDLMWALLNSKDFLFND